MDRKRTSPYFTLTSPAIFEVLIVSVTVEEFRNLKRYLAQDAFYRTFTLCSKT